MRPLPPLPTILHPILVGFIGIYIGIYVVGHIRGLTITIFTLSAACADSTRAHASKTSTHDASGGGYMVMAAWQNIQF